MDERTTEVITECKAIIEAIEAQIAPLSQSALRACRVAQLVDDEITIMWLSLECSGGEAFESIVSGRRWKNVDAVASGTDVWLRVRAVPDIPNMSLGQMADLLQRGGIADTPRVMQASLEELERSVRERRFDQIEMAGASGAAQAIMTVKLLEASARKVIQRVSKAVHEWAVNVYMAHRFRHLAGNIFDRFKTHADAVLARLCPEAIAKLNSASEKASSDNTEDWSAATMSCRRVLKDFADAVYPSREESVDGRKLGEAEYKNRLWAFAKEQGSKAIEKQFLATEEIDGFCRTLDRVYELDSKGIHERVTKQEAHLAVLRTYILLEQLCQLVGAADPA